MKEKNKIIILLMILLVGVTPVYTQKKSDKLKDKSVNSRKKLKKPTSFFQRKKTKSVLL